MNAASAPALWRSIRSNASSSSVRQSSVPSGAGETRPVGVRREDRHRPGLGRPVTTPSGRVGRRRGGAGHAVPALGEPDDLPSAGRHLRQAQRGLVRLGAGGQQQHLVQRWRQPGKRLGEIDHRPRQHPREEVVEAADHVGDDGDDLRVRVPQHGAHLAAREVEHPPPGRVFDERARGAFGDERRPGRAVPHEVTSRPLQIRCVAHRQIIARCTQVTRGDWTRPDLRLFDVEAAAQACAVVEGDLDVVVTRLLAGHVHQDRVASSDRGSVALVLHSSTGLAPSLRHISM